MTNHRTPEFDTPESGSVQRANRRSVLKGAAGLAAIAGTGIGSATQLPRARKAVAQEVDGTRARNWSEEENINTDIKLEGDGWVTLHAEFPFWALGFAWDTGVGTWPAVEYGISTDGQTWDDGYSMSAHSDGGPAAADDRYHTDLHFGNGEEYIRYRTVDGEGNLVVLDRFQITYIDPTDGPWEPDRGATIMRTTATNSDTLVPPTIITRAQWGANENLRYDSTGEIWPPEYQQVEHAIVHHAAVNYGSDGYNAVRSIYYYHAVTQGWGDIGYNYVVDVNGNIFEGRVGGANVIGGHAFEYANGSSGICMMGDFTSVDPPYASKVALANIIAYVVRDLNPMATKPFHAAPALPTICAHRDVNQSSCPGNALYDDLPWIRNTVKSTLDSGLLDSQKPGGIVPGDWVKVQTENNTALPMRRDPGMQYPVLVNIPYGTRVEVERGPLADSQYNWYQVFYNNQAGWVPADYLLVDPPADDPADGYSYGQNLRMTTTTSLRSTPGGSSVGTVSGGSWAFIMAGPLTTAGNTWFQIRTQSNGDGWVPRSTITLAPVYNPVARYPVGSNVITTTATNIRVRPGIAQTSGGTAAAGTNLQVSVAPIAVTDRIWYGVYGGTGTGGGWVEEGHLRAGNDPITVLGNVTASGQQFRTRQAVTMRSGPGTTFSAITTLNSGVMGVVIGGPQTANGYTWWQVRTNADQQGWVATNYIEQIRTGSGNLTGYGIGVTVRTNTTVNLRSDGGTGYPIVATLSANTNGIIVDGPRISTGYTWWQIRTADGRLGWVAQSFIVRTSGNLPSPVGVGDSIRTTVSAVRRSNPRDSSTALPAVPAGTYAVITAGPVEVSSLVWWRILYGSQAGWVPQTTFSKEARFEVGDSAKNTGTNQIYPDLLQQSVRATISWSTTFVVVSGPRYEHGRLWYRLLYGSNTGWIAQDYLSAGNKFAVGDSVKNTGTNEIFPDLSQLSVRNSISWSTTFVVVSGPRYEHGRLWYRLLYGSNTGWIAQDYLSAGNKFAVGDSVKNTGTNEIFPDLSQLSVRNSISWSTTFVVVSGPRYEHGRLWYRLLYGSNTGWIAQDYLSAGNKFAVGDSVKNTGTNEIFPDLSQLSVRNSISWSTTFVVVSGPRYEHGRLWYRLLYGSNTGWIAQDYLSAGNKFAVGDSVKNTGTNEIFPDLSQLSVRNSISWSTTFVVVSGPRYEHGRLWYRLLYGSNYGWIAHDYLSAGNKFAVGDSVKNTGTNQIYPDLSQPSVRTTISWGTTFVVTSGPRYAHGRLWYRLLYGSNYGWIAHDYLSAGNKFAVGDSVKNTGTNVIVPDLSQPSVRDTIGWNTTFVVTNQPRYEWGRIWYPLQSGSTSGWIAQDYISHS